MPTVRMADIMMRAPSLCQDSQDHDSQELKLCEHCRCSPDRFARYIEYRVNLDEGEQETVEGALSWMTEAYPPCLFMGG